MRTPEGRKEKLTGEVGERVNDVLSSPRFPPTTGPEQLKWLLASGSSFMNSAARHFFLVNIYYLNCNASFNII